MVTLLNLGFFLTLVLTPALVSASGVFYMIGGQVTEGGVGVIDVYVEAEGADSYYPGSTVVATTDASGSFSLKLYADGGGTYMLNMTYSRGEGTYFFSKEIVLPPTEWTLSIQLSEFTLDLATVGEEPGIWNYDIPGQSIDMYANTTNTAGVIPVMEWIFVVAAAGEEQYVFLLLSGGWILWDGSALEAWAVNFLLPVTGELFIKDVSLGTLGLDTLTCGYAFSTTDAAGAVVENMVTLQAIKP